ncbi:MAG: hypothetical protein BGN95_11395 [Sphingomonas sp. 66-10]|uniref:universal stress protein n=1 Tax=Sphingomonas sp. 66-10 TaxID=1895848 RepID=UPI000929E294|nr:universal stress protein [Sphingomonas sp. 66-10]OJU18327.1 MAG: hypothetical protein BGN95_11395 [Sphingomonas sp. 66-10]
MKNILLLVHDDIGQESRFQVALDLCRAVNGHLTCLDVLYIPPAIGGAGMYDTSYVVGTLVEREAERETENKHKLEARLAAEDVPWDWIDASSDIPSYLKSAAELADVIVVNRQIGNFWFPDAPNDAADLIVRSGKPILAVPAECKRLDLDSALVAWDGSPCAATALRAAVPLLQQTGQITIFEVQDGSVTTPAEDAASYLSRHNIHAQIRRIGAMDSGAGETLQAEANSGLFGYAVMGGYGHWRIVEAMFGGVTRSMLTKSAIPVFLAH